MTRNYADLRLIGLAVVVAIALSCDNYPPTNSSNTLHTWFKTIDMGTTTSGSGVVAAPDGGFLIAGSALRKNGTDVAQWTDDALLIRTDRMGDTLWTKSYGGDSLDGISHIATTADGGYILVGTVIARDAGDNNNNVFVIRCNSEGDTLWTKTLGGTNTDWGSDVISLAGGACLVLGGTRSFGMGLADFYLTKLDAVGEVVWQATYGGPGQDYGQSIAVNPDGSFVLAGWTTSYGEGSGDVYLIKCNSLGDTVWTRTYGGTGNDHGNSIARTSDGGYVIAGYTLPTEAGKSDAYAIKVDSLGNAIWTKTFGGAALDVIYDVIISSSQAPVFIGRTHSSGSSDIYLVKMDQTGKVLWERTFGGQYYDESSSLIEAPNGGFVFTGMVGGMHTCLVKTGPDGKL